MTATTVDWIGWDTCQSRQSCLMSRPTSGVKWAFEAPNVPTLTLHLLMHIFNLHITNKKERKNKEWKWFGVSIKTKGNKLWQKQTKQINHDIHELCDFCVTEVTDVALWSNDEAVTFLHICMSCLLRVITEWPLDKLQSHQSKPQLSTVNDVHTSPHTSHNWKTVQFSMSLLQLVSWNASPWFTCLEGVYLKSISLLTLRFNNCFV